ncbi:MAG: xanthine dehydrogenase family protein molybdopterin-binding subunit [Clostridiales bacterium]|nr:xanthine dehydrogenase family protein molybdopterin-binding subunit [Clostridiales bacterium]
MLYVGKDSDRIDAQDKVKGLAKYTDDINYCGMLYAKLLLSSVAHAEIVSINKDKALKVDGIVSVVTGQDNMLCFGPCIQDRPPIAFGKVRYLGEPVAMVVAYDEQTAQKACRLIEVEYRELPIINSTDDALIDGAELIHTVQDYDKTITDVYPIDNTNIASEVKIRKGNALDELKNCKFIAKGEYFLPQSDHIAMETRSAIAEIKGDGQVTIISATQSPYEVKSQICQKFKLQATKVNVIVPQVGGAFGGKSAVQLEILAYIASLSAGGRMVKVTNTREQDILCSPGRIGLKAKVTLGADAGGTLKAAHLIYHLDIGAYADISTKIAQAIAVDCTGPYKIDHVYCDSLAIYTNHPYTTAYRGFGHASYTFCIERTIDKLANMMGIDALEFRMKNLISYGDYTPTQVKLNCNNISNLPNCYDKLKSLIDWSLNNEVIGSKTKAWGISSFWKTSNSPTNAVSGALVTFNKDGSVNLNVGVVEFGQGAKTRLVKLLAEILKINPDKITINTEIDTKTSPEHWKTVASLSTFMAGKAIIKAGEDILKQLRELAAIALRCTPEDLDIEDEKVFVKYNKDFFISYKDLIHGLKFEDGTNIGGQILGRGAYGMNHLTVLAKDSGKGKPGAEWTCGAQAVLIEYDSKDHSFRPLKVVTVLDAGALISPAMDRGVIKGGMSMGLGLAMHESFYCQNGRVENTSLRTYKVRHKEDIDIEFIVDFANTPNVEAPYGTRSFSEHGIIGIPAAFANALSRAATVELDTLPLTSQTIWQQKGEQDVTI